MSPALLMPEEVRSCATRFELRDVGTSTLSLKGYASVFDTPYEVAGVTEVVRRGAFRDSLARKPDTALLINHGGIALARTKAGTMRLREDNTGLLVEADLDKSNPLVTQLASAIRRGDMSEMSFAFRDEDPFFNDDYTRRELRRVNIDRGDVSVVNYGASPTTSVEVLAARSLTAARQIARRRRLQPRLSLDHYRARGYVLRLKGKAT